MKWCTIVPESRRKVWDKFIEILRHSGKIIISRPLFNIYEERCFFNFTDLQMRQLRPTVVLFNCDRF